MNQLLSINMSREKKHPVYNYYEITDKKPVCKFCELTLVSTKQGLGTKRNGTKRKKRIIF
jgi:hypothetical protein